MKNKKPEGVYLPYGLSWAQWQRLPESVQFAITDAGFTELRQQKAESDAWWDIVERLDGGAE